MCLRPESGQHVRASAYLRRTTVHTHTHTRTCVGLCEVRWSFFSFLHMCENANASQRDCILVCVRFVNV